MYREYYGFTEPPFDLTPDSRFLFRGGTHAAAFDLVAGGRGPRGGVIVITGDCGAGKTTLCRAWHERPGPRTVSALLLAPCLSETDLLTRILRDFGVVSREGHGGGRMSEIGASALMDALDDFLLSLRPLGARGRVIVDEAQDLPRQVLERIRGLSNAGADTDTPLQIVLVGRSDLDATVGAAERRDPAPEVSIRHELRPLTEDEVAGYIFHRLTLAGGGSSVVFRPAAIETIHRLSLGNPRAINELSDRALQAGCAARTGIIESDVVHAGSELVPARAAGSAPPRGTRPRRRVAVAVALGLAVLIGTAAAGVGYLVSQGYRLRVTDRFPPVAVERLVDTPTASADLEPSRP